MLNDERISPDNYYNIAHANSYSISFIKTDYETGSDYITLDTITLSNKEVVAIGSIQLEDASV